MSQEPWNDELFEEQLEEVEDEQVSVSRRNRKVGMMASSRLFTILASIFVFFLLAIIILAIYLSTGGSNTDSTEGFYNAENAQVAASSSSEQDSNATETTETTEAATEESSTEASSAADLVDRGDGTTTTVQPGEGLASIANRAGISMAELERLNPEKMVGPGGTWWANPGDVVRIR